MKYGWPYLLVVAVVVSAAYAFTYSPGHKEKAFYIPEDQFQSGDIILRDGRGILSKAFRQMSRTEQKYSHAGIVHFEQSTAYVYHMVTAEGSKSGTMRKDSLAEFVSPDICDGYGVYRTSLPGGTIDTIAETFYRSQITFDDQFDLATDNKMYCTELVYKILGKISGNDNFLPLTEVNGIRYVACDNIYLSPHVKLIFATNKQ